MPLVLSGDTGVNGLENHDQIFVDDIGNTAINGDLKLHSGYTALSSTNSGAMTVLGHNATASDTVANRIVTSNTGYHSHFIRMYYNQGISFHVNNSTGSAGDVVYDFATPSYQVASAKQAMNIDIEGRVLKPYTPAFDAISNYSPNGGPTGVQRFDNIRLNRGSNFDGQRFTAPVTGIYQFNVTLMSRSGGYVRCDTVINGTKVYHTENTRAASNFDVAQFNQAVYMVAGDYIYWDAGSYNTYGSTYNYASGFLIG